jgi:hypothetical protein
MSSLVRTLGALAAVAVVTAAGVFLAQNTRASADDRAADVNVSCAPSQRAVIRQTMSGAAPQVDILCVDAVGAVPTGYIPTGAGGYMPAAYTAAPVAVPAVHAPTATPVAAAPSRNPSLTKTSTAARTVKTSVSRQPSTRKRVMIIGGSAGAGAGIGALIGGKKGALIGAAIGGGGAAVVDQVKYGSPRR